MKFHPVIKCLVFLAAASMVSGASQAQAAMMQVGFPRSHETKQIDLSENERGIIEVHLASDGCMLDGYHVSLVDESRRRVLKTLK
ncbi:MAG: hypothetical protein KDD66_07825, partial [Bdellovibrionales bacterium]|nr:hypothetical protein [Bdellovibrionales bacterium]